VSVHYLDLADFLIIAEAVLGSPADQIVLQTKLAQADSALHAPAASFTGEEFYPDFPTKAAVLCAHLVGPWTMMRSPRWPGGLLSGFRECLPSFATSISLIGAIRASGYKPSSQAS
jgi:hypothetical protein